MSTGYKSHCHYLPDVKYLHFRPGSCSRTSPALLSSGRSAWPGTVADVAAPPTGADPGADPGAGPGADPGAEVAVTTGVASLAVRDLLRGGRRHGKILARLPHAIYLEFADTVPEPRVIAVSPPDAIRLPNAIITGPWDAPPSAPTAGSGECWAGGSRVLACGLDIRIVRWWDPSPVFGPLSRARLDHGSGVLARLYAAAEHAPGLAGQDVPGSSRRAAQAVTWPGRWRRLSTSWGSVPAWCRAATAWSAACCSRCVCWAGLSPAGPGRCGSRTGSARR